MDVRLRVLWILVMTSSLLSAVSLEADHRSYATRCYPPHRDLVLTGGYFAVALAIAALVVSLVPSSRALARTIGVAGSLGAAAFACITMFLIVQHGCGTD